MNIQTAFVANRLYHLHNDNGAQETILVWSYSILKWACCLPHVELPAQLLSGFSTFLDPARTTASLCKNAFLKENLTERKTGRRRRRRRRWLKYNYHERLTPTFRVWLGFVLQFRQWPTQISLCVSDIPIAGGSKRRLSYFAEPVSLRLWELETFP